MTKTCCFKGAWLILVLAPLPLAGQTSGTTPPASAAGEECAQAGPGPRDWNWTLTATPFALNASPWQPGSAGYAPLDLNPGRILNLQPPQRRCRHIAQQAAARAAQSPGWPATLGSVLLYAAWPCFGAHR